MSLSMIFRKFSGYPAFPRACARYCLIRIASFAATPLPGSTLAAPGRRYQRIWSVSRPDHLGAETLLKLTINLMASAGRGEPRGLSRLAGCKNNQVYRVDTGMERPLVLKRYFVDARDQR